MITQLPAAVTAASCLTLHATRRSAWSLRRYAVGVDRRVAAAVWRRRSPLAVSVGRLVGVCGDPLAVAAVTAVAAALNRCGSGRLYPIAVVAAGAVARHHTARVIARRRPPAAVRRVPVHGPSFPSKHTTLAVLAAGAIAHACSARHRYAGAAMLGVAVGAARVIVGAHWPSDVLAGIGFGATCWWLADRCLERTR